MIQSCSLNQENPLLDGYRYFLGQQKRVKRSWQYVIVQNSSYIPGSSEGTSGSGSSVGTSGSFSVTG